MEDTSFAGRVYDVVGRIPEGRAISYGMIARMIGAPRCARHVGFAMRHCPEALPWHRVVKADGSMACGGEPELRRALLAQEGVPFTADGRVDLAACGWMG